MSTENELTHPKISVYIAIGSATTLAIADIITNGNIEASTTIVLALIGFAAGRQLLKSTLGK